MAAAADTAAVSMKLLINPNSQRVLFGEAGKDVVDFLFSFLALPVSTAVKLIGKDSMVGSVGNLYASVEELDDTYLMHGAAKGALLRSPMPDVSSLNHLPEPPPSSGQPKTMYTCGYSSCRTYVTDVSGKVCPYCRTSMTTSMQYVSGSGQPAASAGKGFVQGIVTYTVQDNLKVTPMSAISSIALLNTLAVTNIGALQEKTVQLGNDEGLAILKASLQSKTVLTDVFLGNNNVIDDDDDDDLDNVDY